MYNVGEGGILSRKVNLGPGSVGDVRGRVHDSCRSCALSARSVWDVVLVARTVR